MVPWIMAIYTVWMTGPHQWQTQKPSATPLFSHDLLKTSNGVL